MSVATEVTVPFALVIFGLTLLLSGFAGISYEILYARILSNIIGDQFAVSAAILITFLFGIGVGAVRAHRLWKHLWLIEAGIGLYGVVFAASHELLDMVLYRSSFFSASLFGRVAFSITTLAVPSFLIGCSIPLFSGYLARLGTERSFAWVYGIYNLGAAITALAIEFALIRALGIKGAVLAVASLNGIVAVVLRVGFHHLSQHAPDAAVDAALPPSSSINRPMQWLREHRLQVALVLASIASAAFQLLMVKLAEMFMGPFRETFAIVLSVVLLGIPAGAFWVRQRRISLSTALFVAAFALVILYVLTEPLARMYAAHYPIASEGYAALVLLKWLFVACLMGPAAIAFGSTIPAILQNDDGVAKNSGHLLFLSSVANAAGFVLMTFVLHRSLSYGHQLLAMIVLTVAAGAVAEASARGTIKAMAIATLSLVTLKHNWNEDFLYLSYTAFHSRDKLKSEESKYDRSDIFRGHQDVFSILWKDNKPFLFINGYISIPLNNPSEMMVGAIGSLFSPRQDEAVVLGLGSGGTASVVGMLFDKLDVVEINTTIVDNIDTMRRWNFNIAKAKNVNIIIDDGINFLKETTKTYSLILNTVTSPLYFSSAKLYTDDFFKVVKAKLKPDGVYLTWVDSRIGDTGIEIILQTLKPNFKFCSLMYMKSTYHLLMCSDEAVRARDPLLVSKSAQVQQLLMTRDDLDVANLAYHYTVRDAFKLIGDAAPAINRIDFPVLEFEIARLRGGGLPRITKRISDEMNLKDLNDAIAFPTGTDVGNLILHTDDWLGADANIAKRWRELAAQTPDFDATLAAARLRHARTRLAIGKRPDDHYRLGLELKRQGELKAAQAAFEEGLRLDPKLNDAEYMLARCFEDQGLLQDAVLHAKRELANDPKDPDVGKLLKNLQLKIETPSMQPRGDKASVQQSQ